MKVMRLMMMAARRGVKRPLPAMPGDNDGDGVSGVAGDDRNEKVFSKDFTTGRSVGLSAAARPAA
jgi:hypothetical protein